MGCGSSVFEDLADYMSSLQKMRSLMLCAPCKEGDVEPPSVLHTICPGHGLVIREDGLQKIDDYITHRTVREEQILNCLKCSESPISSLQVVENVYKDMKLNIVLRSVPRALW